jgi:hypothetical protein
MILTKKIAKLYITEKYFKNQFQLFKQDDNNLFGINKWLYRKYDEK